MKTTQKKSKKRLTNAGKRHILTLASVMIKIPYKGRVIECSSAAEAIELLKHIDAEDRTSPGMPKMLHSLMGLTNPWSKTAFWEFIDSLGDAQKRVLGLLLRKPKVSDEELRKMLKVDSNQALAGVLSGISKQAAVLNISARSVYTAEDERRDGTLIKTYSSAADFRQIADDMNWPNE